MMLEEVFVTRKRRQYTREFKVEAVKLVTEGGMTVVAPRSPDGIKRQFE